MKHTPGPWLRERGVADKDWDIYVLDGDSDQHICRVADHGDDEDKANARLIAAAPELLEALKRINDNLIGPAVNGMEPPSNSEGVAILWSDARSALRIARDAILKAEGKVTV